MESKRFDLSVKRPLLFTASLLLIPLVAMQLTDEVNWTVGDFFIAGILIFATAVSYDNFSKRSNNKIHRFLIGTFLLIAFTGVWIELSVGIL